MNKKILMGVVILIAVIALSFFIGIKNHSIISNKQISIKNSNTNTQSSDIISANTLFALKLYDQYKSDKGNIFYSPYSISTALAMTYEGARGQTADEIAKVFHFPLEDNLRRNQIKTLYSSINQQNNKFKLSTANALWAEKTYTLLPDYLSLVSQYYDGNVTNLDFKQNPEDSRQTINDWVAGKTNDKIKDILPSKAITSDTRLVLTNAVYFLGNWTNKFEKEATYDQNFNIIPSNTIKINMMHQEKYFNYFEDSNMQALEMPYDGGNLSMIVLLPKTGDTKNLENSLTYEKLKSVEKNLKVEEVRVSIPKFKFETKYFMAETLKEMGMPSSFDSGKADFSGMDGTKNLSISAVIHQAYVSVDEEGTEAAAATAVVMMETSAGPGEPKPEPKIFTANHPFIFLIEDRTTGMILFMGRMSNPSSA